MFGATLILALAMVMPGHCSGGGMQRFGATNMAADLAGDPDNRPGTWGTAGAQSVQIHFAPPAGCRVRITRVYGDFLAWARGVVPPGTYAGVLFGLSTAAPDGSTNADLISNSCFVYYQAVIGSDQGARIQYDIPGLNVILPDGVLVEKVAVWLNNTGQIVHMEPSYVIVYEWF